MNTSISKKIFSSRNLGPLALAAVMWILIDGTLDSNGPAMCFDDAFHDREAETGSLPKILRREKGLEDLRADLFRHPMAGIGHPEAHVAALTSEAQPEPSPLRHGMEAIHHQIDQHLDKLVSIGMDRGKFASIDFSTVMQL